MWSETKKTLKLLLMDYPGAIIDYQYPNGTIKVKQFDHIIGKCWLIDRYGNIEEV